MSHFHLVLDWEEGEIIGLALPVAGTGPGSDTEKTAVLSSVSFRTYAFPEPVINQSLPGIAPKTYHGGRRLTPDQYEVFESVPGTSGYDRVRIKYFSPVNDVLVDYVPA